MWKVKRIDSPQHRPETLQEALSKLDKQDLHTVLYKDGYWFIVYWDRNGQVEQN